MHLQAKNNVLFSVMPPTESSKINLCYRIYNDENLVHTIGIMVILKENADSPTIYKLNVMSLITNKKFILPKRSILKKSFMI